MVKTKMKKINLNQRRRFSLAYGIRVIFTANVSYENRCIKVTSVTERVKDYKFAQSVNTVNNSITLNLSLLIYRA